MSMQKIIGLVIAAAGLVAVFLAGESMVLLIIGIVAAVAGLGVFLINPKGKK